MLVLVRKLALLAVIVAVGGAAPTARAGFTVSAQTVNTSPSGTEFVQITLTNDSATALELSGFSFDLALGGSGVRFTGVDSLTTPGYVFADFGTGTLTFDEFPNAGFNASDLSLGPAFVSVGAGETVGLARVGFAADGGASAGVRAITFGAGPGTAFLDAGGNPYAAAEVSFVAGGINVQAEPEVSAVPTPGAVVLFASGLGWFGLLRTATRWSRPA
jgi:hypothetical protein